MQFVYNHVKIVSFTVQKHVISIKNKLRLFSLRHETYIALAEFGYSAKYLDPFLFLLEMLFKNFYIPLFYFMSTWKGYSSNASCTLS